MPERRVVVTGTGVVTPLGDTREELHRALCAGTSGIKPAEKFIDPALKDPLVGEITAFAPAKYLEKRNYRPLDRTSLLLTSAAQLALNDSGWTPELREQHAVGLVAGTTFCSVHTISKFDCCALTDGPGQTSPLDFANTVINAAAGQCAIWHGLRGVNSTISSGITSGLEAIGYAARLIREGHEQAILAGGVEELCVESLLGFQQAGMLCTANGAPAKYPMPFDALSPGFALAEGASILLLEELDAALKRGAKVLAEIRGFGSSFDCGLAAGEARIAKRAACISRAINQALDSAGVAASSVGALSASANGHELMDRCEAQAIKQVFNGGTKSLAISAPKSAVGESLGASGGLQAIEMIASFADNQVACVARVEEGSPLASLKLLPSGSRGVAAKACLINSVGIDGNCCSLVMGPY